MHYVITGGCGFIGSHLAQLLAAQGHTLAVIDDLSTGKRENLTPGAAFIHGDITAPGIFDDAVARADGCFHLAAIVSVQRSAEDWLRTHQVNQGGTVALFDALARAGRKIPVVLASSAAVYGDCADIPLKESARTAPLSAYGADKLACEWQAAVAAGVHCIPTAALRFFNVYGPRQDPTSPYSGVISVFMHRMKNHLPVTIYGDGEQSRDFICASDVAQALELAMRQLHGGRRMHGVFNVCTGRGTSVNALAKRVAEITGSRSAVTHAPARAADIRHSLGDGTLAAQALGFQARTLLQDGLQLLHSAA